jgi:hypothetical protein
MIRSTQFAVAILLTLLAHRAAVAEMVVFDFDGIQSLSQKGSSAPAIELYMEGLFGSDVTVSPNTALGRTGAVLQSPSTALGLQNGFLKTGKGRGAGISFDFGDNPINSFSVDWLLTKRGKIFTIIADGVAIKHVALSKAQNKAGLSGHQDAYFFDQPVKTLQFLGRKKKFAIDNLIINIPLADSEETEDPETQNESNQNESGYPNESGDPNGYRNGNENENGATVPEPSSMLLLVLGLCGAWLTRRVATVCDPIR